METKTINMGSMFRVDFRVSLKDTNLEKQMVDEIRIRNGNLEVYVQRTDYISPDL